GQISRGNSVGGGGWAGHVAGPDCGGGGDQRAQELGHAGLSRPLADYSRRALHSGRPIPSRRNRQPAFPIRGLEKKIAVRFRNSECRIQNSESRIQRSANLKSALRNRKSGIENRKSEARTGRSENIVWDPAQKSRIRSKIENPKSKIFKMPH